MNVNVILQSTNGSIGNTLIQPKNAVVVSYVI